MFIFEENLLLNSLECLYSTKSAQTNLKNLVHCIFQNENLRLLTEKARLSLKNGDKESYTKAKNQFPAVMPHAVCPEGRSADKPCEPTGLLMYDFDHLDDAGIRAESLVEKAKEWDYVVLATVSLSGNGVHVIVRVDGVKAGNFKDYYNYYAVLLDDNLGARHDPACNDIKRLMIYNHDPHCYFNPEARDISNTLPYVEPAIAEPATANSSLGRYLDKVEGNLSMDEGHRHTSMVGLSACLNHAGFDEEDAVLELSRRYAQAGFTATEIEKTVRDIYRRYAAEHGRNAKSPKVQQVPTEESAEEEEAARFPVPPSFDSFKEKLPAIFEAIIRPDMENDFKWLEFRSHTVALSCMMRNITYIDHEQNLRYPCLSLYVEGKSGSGKSHMTKGMEGFAKGHAARLEAFSRKRIEEAKKKLKEKKLCNELLPKGVKGKGKRSQAKQPAGEPAPELPKEIHVLFDGSTSKVGFIQVSNANEGWPSLLCSTEADSMGKNKAVCDDLRLIMRQLPAGERIGNNSAMNGYLALENPKGGWMISGTPQQTQTLFQSSEDGTVNRAEFILLKDNIAFNTGKDIDDTDTAILEKQEALVARYRTLSTYFENQHARVHFTPAVRALLGDFVEKALEKSRVRASDAINNYNKRLLEKLYKNCAVMTALFAAEANVPQGTSNQLAHLTVTEETAALVLSFAPYWLESGYVVLDRLPEQPAKFSDRKTKQREEFFNALDEVFTRKQFMAEGKTRGIGEKSTLDNVLREWLKAGLAEKIRHGEFRKTRSEQVVA